MTLHLSLMTRMKIDIVTHCHRYWRVLTHQLSSFCLHPPKSCRVQLHVFYTHTDRETDQVLRFFEAIHCPNLEWRWHQQTLGELRQRAIGRNLIARSTTADLVWFTDADILFRQGVLDRLAETTVGSDSPLFYPQSIRASLNHFIGDRAIDRVGSGPRLIDIDEADFHEQTFNRAIGPIQICRGSVIRNIGYCDDPKWQRPASSWSFRSDVVLRRTLGTSGTPVALPGVFRIRHSRAGYQTNDPVEN